MRTTSLFLPGKAPCDPLPSARDGGVKRVVLTSAFHAVAYGYAGTDHEFNDEDLTVLDGPGATPYAKSKTLAERAAWDFMPAERGGMELATILPVAVMGPVMGSNISGSNRIIQRLLEAEMPGYPNLWIPIVDVRDVASAHELAMTTPEAAGQRFLLSIGPAIPINQIGSILKESLGEVAKKRPDRSIPDLVVRVASIFNKEFRALHPDLGFARKMTRDNANRILEWQPRRPREAIVAAAEILVEKGLVKV